MNAQGLVFNPINVSQILLQSLKYIGWNILRLMFFLSFWRSQKRTVYSCRLNFTRRTSASMHSCLLNQYLPIPPYALDLSDCLSEWMQDQVNKELIIHDCLLTYSLPLKHVWATHSRSNSEIIYFSGSIDCLPQCNIKCSLWGQSVIIVWDQNVFRLGILNNFLVKPLLKSGHFTGHDSITLQTTAKIHLSFVTWCKTNPYIILINIVLP